MQDSPPSCIDQETVKISEPSQASHSCTVAKDSDQGSSSCEEEWDETDSEGDDSSADGQHPQAKSFVKWIVALLLEFQAPYVLPYNATQCFFYLSLYIIFHTVHAISNTVFASCLHAFPRFTLFGMVCPKCDSIYKLEECIIRSETQLMSQRCSYVAFRNHPQRRYRLPCNTILLKTVTLKGG